MSNVTNVPVVSASSYQGQKLVDGQCSQLLSGSVKPASIPHTDEMLSESKKYFEYTQIPQIEGFFMLSSKGVEQPVQVVFDAGLFFVKTFSGQRLAELSESQVLVGPIANVLDIPQQKVTKKRGTSIPSMPEFERENILSQQDYISIEHDLSEALDYVEKLKEENLSLAKSVKNHPSNKLVKQYLADKEDALSKLQIAAQRVAVSEEEATAAFAELDGLQGVNSDLKHRVSQLEALVQELKQAKESSAGALALPEEFIVTVNRIKTLLLHVKMSSKEPTTYKLLTNLINGLCI